MFEFFKPKPTMRISTRVSRLKTAVKCDAPKYRIRALVKDLAVALATNNGASPTKRTIFVSFQGKTIKARRGARKEGDLLITLRDSGTLESISKIASDDAIEGTNNENITSP